MLHIKKRTSPFMRFWLLFLGLLIPVILFGIFVYHYNLDSNLNYINQMRLYSFQQASTQLGYIFEQFKGMAADIAVEISSSDDEIDKQKLFEKLSECEDRAVVECEAFYYERGKTFLYSNSEQLTYTQFEKERASNTFTLSGFFSRLNQTVLPHICPIMPNDPNQDGLVGIICPLATQGKIPEANIFFLIPEEALNEKFKDYFGDSQGELCVYTSNLEIILSQKTPAPEIETLAQYKGIGLISEPNDDDVVLRQLTADDGLVIISIMSSDEFYKELRVTQSILLMLIILMLICCVAVAVIGIKYAYHPFQLLTREILGSSKKNHLSNEIDLIRDAFHTTQEQSLNLKQQLDNQNQMLSEQFVIRLISGSFQTAEEIQRYARCFGLTMSRKYWVVMQLVINCYPSSRQIVDQMLEGSKEIEISEAECLYSEFLQHPGICYLFHFDCQGNPQEYSKKIAEELCQYIQNKGLYSFKIGVGNTYEDPLMIKRSSYEADAAMENAANFDNRQIYYYHPDQGAATEGISLPPMEKSILVTGLSHGDKEVSLHALEGLINYIEQSGSSFLMVRLLCSELSNTLLHFARENHISYRQSNWTELIAYQDINTFRSSAEELTEYLCEQILQRRIQDKIRQKDDVLTFITQSFTRDDFSLDLVADSLNLTKTNISSIVKEEIGMGFPQYISLLRLNEIKRQLVETSLPIQDIIRGVGYLDVSNFIRRFKSLEGMTPGQYRNVYRKE